MKHFLFLFSLLIVFGCSDVSIKSDREKTKTGENQGAKHEVIDIWIEFAQNFELKTVENGYALDLIDPGTQNVEAHYELTYDSKKTGDNVIHLPLDRIAALSQTSAGMMVELDADKMLSGISNLKYVYDSDVRKRVRSGKIVELGDESNFPVEKTAKSKTQLIVYSGFGKEFPQESKLKKLGIQMLPNYEWRENHPLGRAEWIKIIGILCGKEQEAIDLFDKTVKSYEQLKWKARNVDHYPTVISGNLMGDQWYAPAGESYMATIFQDAGADYVYQSSSGTGSVSKSLETIILDNERTEFWLNPGVKSRAEVLNINAKLRLVGPFNRNMYGNSHDRNKFWEQSSFMPHLLLEDFIRIFHPELLTEGDFHFYQKIED